MSQGDRRTAVALPFGVAFILILSAAVSLAVALIADGNDAGPPLVALVVSVGGLFLLGIGVIRRSGSARSAG